VGGPFPSVSFELHTFLSLIATRQKFLTMYEDEDRVRGSFGTSGDDEGNWPRLVELKKKWDPKGIFKTGLMAEVPT
jgi:hypothetical protein